VTEVEPERIGLEKGEDGPHLSRIEWEGLQGKWEIEERKESSILPSASQKIEVWRDEQYKLKAKVTGTPTDALGGMFPDYLEPGTLVPSVELNGSDLYGTIDYKLSNCAVKSTSQRGNESFEADLVTHRVRRRFLKRESAEMAWLTEWYLNSYSRNTPLLYPRPVKRELKEEYRKEREFLGEEITFEGYRKGALGRCAFVETPDVSFLVQPVPNELGPPWSKCLGIEYRLEWGGVPNADDRKAIANILSFLMGRPLVDVGYTAYDGRGYPIEQVAINPRADNLVAMCQRPEQPPINLEQRKPPAMLEGLLQEMVPCYLALREELNLDEVLQGYWLADQLPLGDDLPVLATSIEILKNAWYKSKKSKSKGTYMPKAKFDELLEDEFKAIEARLEGVEYGDRILRRMRNTFQMGVNESFDFFFEEIGLPVGERERKAIGARNRMAHGSSGFLDERAYQELLNKKQSYQTLFNRILLKVMGYDGNYVDRSTLGWPERPLDQPIGESP